MSELIFTRDSFVEYITGEIGEIENCIVNAFIQYQKAFLEQATPEEREQFELDKLFNFFYRQTLELCANSLYSGRSMLVDNPANYRNIDKMDLPTRRQLLTFYTDTFKENLKSITADYVALGSALPYITKCGEYYETHVTEDFKTYTKHAAEVFRKVADMVLDSYTEYTTQVSTAETDKVQRVITAGLSREKRPDTFARDYCDDGGLSDIYEKYELVINYSIFTAESFDAELFKRVVEDRLLNLSQDKYQVQENYLLEHAKKTPDLKASIIRMVETARLGTTDAVEDLVNQLVGL
jgi:hypothetical protein